MEPSSPGWHDFLILTGFAPEDIVELGRDISLADQGQLASENLAV
jgi:hypothetical protein